MTRKVPGKSSSPLKHPTKKQRLFNTIVSNHLRRDEKIRWCEDQVNRLTMDDKTAKP